MNIRASIAHGALAIPLFWLSVGIIYMLPNHWAAATVNSLLWLTRELAQSFRPSAPFRINLTQQSLVDWLIPTAVGFVIALIVEVV